MITKKTVLILGAGSNLIYGFPSGRELRWKIINQFNSQIDRLKSLLPTNFSSRAKSFIKEFDNSHIQSIDKFLTMRNEFYDVGKFAIALQITISEIKSSFSDNLEYSKLRDDWYSYLYNEYIEDIRYPADIFNLANKNLDIITFNYDRSIDYFLSKSLTSSLSKSIELHSINSFLPDIYHVYGAPKLQYQTNSSYYLDYPKHTKNFDLSDNSEIFFTNIMTMADSIRIISDERNTQDDSNFVDKIRSTIKEAENILILGFGFARENLDILGFPDNV